MTQPLFAWDELKDGPTLTTLQQLGEAHFCRLVTSIAHDDLQTT